MPNEIFFAFLIFNFSFFTYNQPKPSVMFKNYFKIAWRNLFRNKGFSLTNILGLTIGITCTILISFWVQDELAFNKFHKNYNNIYQVMANRNFNNQKFTDENMVLPLASSI